MSPGQGVGTAPEDHTAPAAGTDGAVPREPGESDFVSHEVEPEAIFHPDPEYPEWARESGIQGRVLLHVLVGVDGRVRRVVIQEDIIGLGEAAAKGISRWVFRPARSNGQPVSVWVKIPVRFYL